jgi:predicted TIM-barrel fold metal-dependent hydrolase
LQPIDAPPDTSARKQLLDQIGSDKMLLFSTDYPHWYFEGNDAVPKSIPVELARKIMVDNPLQTYPRLTR